MPDNPKDKAKAIYDAASQEYDLGSYDEFQTKLKDPAKRQALYNAIGQEYDLGDYNTFNQKLGFDSKEAQQQNVIGQTVQDQSAPTPDNGMDIAHLNGTVGTIRQAQQRLKEPAQPTTAFMTSPNTAIPLSTEDNNDAEKRGLLQSSLDNGIQSLADQWGKPKEDVQDVVNKFPTVNDAQQLQELTQLKSDNPVLYNRTAASTTWQNILYKHALQNNPEGYNDLVNEVHQSQNWGVGTTFQDARAYTRYMAKLINENVTDDKERQEAQQALAESNANAYGGTMQGTDEALATDKDMGFLNKAEKLGLSFLDDTNPELAKGFRNNIGIDPSHLQQQAANGKVSPERVGYSEQKAQLASTGADLMLRVAQQHLAEYNKTIQDAGANYGLRMAKEKMDLENMQVDKTSQQSIDNYNKAVNQYNAHIQDFKNNSLTPDKLLTPEQQQDYAQYQKQYSDAIDLKDRIHNPNDKEYGLAAQFELDNIAQELTTQKKGFFSIEGNRFIKDAIIDPALSILTPIQQSYSSEENNKKLQLALIGAQSNFENKTYVRQDNQPMQQFEMVLPADLEDKVNAVNDNKILSDAEKREQIKGILAIDQRWYKQPIDPKFNPTTYGLLYGFGDATNSVLGFMAKQELLGAGGNASKVQRILTTAANVGLTDYSNKLIENYKNNVPNPVADALIHTGINMGVFAGGDMAGAIEKVAPLRKLLGNTAASEVLNKLSDEEILNLAKKVPSKYVDMGKALLESQKGNLHMTALGMGATIANDAVGGKLQSPTDYAKQGLLQYVTTLPVSFLGIKGKYDELNEVQKHGWYDIASKPEDYNKAADAMVANGTLSPDAANVIKANIQKAADVHNNTNYTYDNGKVMSDDAKAKLLLTRIQQGNLKEESKKNNSDKTQAKIAHEELVANEYANLLHEGADIDKLQKRKDKLQSDLDAVDENGKSKLSDKEQAQTKAQLDAIDQYVKENENKSKTDSENQQGKQSTEKTKPANESINPIEQPTEKTIGEVIDKPVLYDGKEATLYQDGQTLIASIDGTNKEYEIGNIDKVTNEPLSNHKISERPQPQAPAAQEDIPQEQSVVSVADNGNYLVRGKEYTNPFETRDNQSPLEAITHDKDGNIVNVRMKTPDGKRVTIRGQAAEDLAYQIHLKEINKDNATRAEFEQFINTDTDAKAAFDNGGLPKAPEEKPIETDAAVPKEPQPSTEIPTKESSPQEPDSNQVTAGEPTEPKSKPAVGKYEAKARELVAAKNKLADKIQLPDFLKVTVDTNGASKSGFSAEDVHNALDKAVIAVGKALDKGIELKEAIKEAVKDLVAMQGKDNEENILKGFEGYYRQHFLDEEPKESSSTANIGGIAARIKKARGIAPESGAGWSREQAAQIGDALIGEGIKPEDVVREFEKDGLISGERMAVANAQARILARQTDAIGDKEGITSQAYKDAKATEKAWAERVQPMQTEWQKSGVGQQGTDLPDYTSPTSILRAKEKATGKTVTELPETIQQSSDRVKTLEKENARLKEKLQAELDKAKSESKSSEAGRIEKAFKKAADTFRKLKTKPFTFRDENGNEIPFQTQGFTWNDLVEAGAKAIEATGKVADGVAAIIDKVKEEDWYKNLSDKGRQLFEKQVTDHFEGAIQDTPEAKLIKRLQKELDDVRQGIVKQKGIAIEDTPEVKDLREQLFEAKKNLGLIKSKQLPESKLPISEEQKRVNRLEKELADLEQGIVKEKTKPFEDTPAIKALKDKIFEAKKNLGLLPSKVKEVAASDYDLKITAEEKKIERLEKEKKDLEAGIIKQQNVSNLKPTPEQQAKIDSLNNDIHDLKKNLGLLKSKAAKPEDTVSPEVKAQEQNIKRLEKQLDDLRAGNIKEKGGKRDLSQEEKDLQEQIFEEKKKLGLIASKMPKPESEADKDAQAEAKNITRLEKELEDAKKDRLKAKPESREPSDKEKELQVELANEKNRIKYENLVKSFAGKTDNTFTPEQSADMWDYAKQVYIDNNPNFSVVEMVNKLAMDFGITPEQVRHGLAPTKEAKRITNQLYRNQYEKNKAGKTIERWVQRDKENTIVNSFFEHLSAPFRELATFAHGHALLFTHAGMNLYDPTVAKAFIKASVGQFKLVYGKSENYAKAIADLEGHPLYATALKAGLAVDPHTIYDDWQLANTFLAKMKLNGNKGFLVLKAMRFEIFKSEFNRLSEVEKADEQTIKNIAQIANHWTGTAGIKPSAAANAVIFAPNLIVSKFARLTTDPLKATVTLGKLAIGKEVSVSDRAAAKVIMMKTGRIFATYIASLAANQALLSLTGSTQSVNFTHPLQSDWLKYKLGDAADDKTIDLTSGIASTLQFIASVFKLPFEAQKETKDDYYGANNATDAAKGIAFGFIRKSGSPFGGTLLDFITHTDYNGNVLPVYDDKPRGSREKLSWLQYAGEKIPIPLAEMYHVMHEQMVAEGVDKPTAKTVMEGFLIGAVASAGVKIGNSPTLKPTPFNEQDKKDPTFKFFIDKGMQLPNVSLSATEITDTKAGTSKNVSDYPKEIQEQYQQAHKEALKSTLEKYQSYKTVFVTPLKDAFGNDKSSVSINVPKKGNYKEVAIDKLNKAQLAQVLSLAQKEATSMAKYKVFHIK